MRGTLLFAFLLLTFPPNSYGRPPADPDSAVPWREEAKKRLSESEFLHLEHDKLVISSSDRKRVYDFYQSGDLPIFITSDSLLAAYHALYSESFMRLERAQAERLLPLLRLLWADVNDADKEIDGEPALVARAKLRARVIVGTAIKLLGEDPAKPTAEEAKLITSEAAKITAATANEMPQWLGKPDPTFTAIDYSRFKPRGFYTHSPRLQRFFRAVSWLEAIPLRPNHPEELLCALMLARTGPAGEASGLQNANHGIWGGYFKPYEKLIGLADDAGLEDIAESRLFMKVPDDLEGKAKEIEAEILQRLGNALVNDQQQDEPQITGSPAPQLSIRIMPARRLPDAVLFQRTTSVDELPRAFPGSLEVAAMLGSEFAGGEFPADLKEPLLKIIREEAAKLFDDDEDGVRVPLYGQYLRCLSSLLVEPEKDAPALFDSRAWQVKSCQTVLGSWAQQRHTLVLQAKENMGGLFGEPPAPPGGFVEPNPIFFSQIADLAHRTQAMLKEFGACEADLHGQADRLRNVAKSIEKADLRNQKLDGISKLPPDDQEEFWRTMIILQVMAETPSAEDATLYLRIAELPASLRKLAEGLDRGEMPANAEIRKELSEEEEDLSRLWFDFERLSRQLESMAHRQLRQRPFTRADNRFFEQYADELKHLMLCSGGFESDIDDSPRIVDVFAQSNPNQYLEVGTGRPRAIYVLYRWEGNEILCLGAVVPFYEFVNKTRLNDEEWKQLLDSRKAPKPPDWAVGIYEGDGPAMPRPPEGETQ